MPGKPEEPKPEESKTETQEKDTKTSEKGSEQQDLSPKPSVRRLSRVAVGALLVLFFITVGFLSMRFPRGGRSEEAPKPPPSFEVPGIDPEQLEAIAQRQLEQLRRRQAGEAPQSEPEEFPWFVGPPPPPPGASAPPRAAARRSIFDVPMAPQGGRRSFRGGRGGGAAPSLPDLSLPARDRELLERLAQEPTPQAREGFVTEDTNALQLEILDFEGPLLRRGSYLPVVLTHAVNTDVPGLIRGHLARDIRDSMGRYRLLPQGTVVVGRQRGALSAEDSRLIIDWQSIQLPDGRSIELSEPQGTAAMDGSLGATGRIRRHWGSRFGTALLLGALGATTQLSQPQQSAEFGRAASGGQLAAGEVGARLNELAERTLERQLDRPPTIQIQAGARLNLLLLNDLVFPPQEP